MKCLCMAILFACVTATAANAREAKADLVDFKYRADQQEDFARKRIRIVGSIINKSATEFEAAICLRLYDADGFEVHHGQTPYVKLSTGQSDTATATTYLTPKEWAEVVSLKAYVARHGCVNSPSQALSPVVEMKTTPEPEQVTVDGVNLADLLNASVNTLRSALPEITDEASLQAALPKINEATAQLDDIRARAAKLPPQGRSVLAKLTGLATPAINQLIDKVIATPAGAVAKPAIDEVRARLDSLSRV